MELMETSLVQSHVTPVLKNVKMTLIGKVFSRDSFMIATILPQQL